MTQPRRILVVIGTRPEAIKLAPVIAELRRWPQVFECRVCTTSQHHELLAAALQAFDLVADFDLAVMQANQQPSDVLARVLQRFPAVLAASAPNLLLVQGDTTSALAAALAAAYARIPIAHVEAGVRTHDPAAPWPEESNRRLVDALASLHFAPTAQARRNLLAEGVPAATIHVTGNTGIDALRQVYAGWGQAGPRSSRPRRTIVVTFHRRESIPAGIQAISHAIVQLAAAFPQVDFVLPLHPNPAVLALATPILCDRPLPNIRLSAPLDYAAFIALLAECYLILTDSGGVEEEAPYLGKPVLILRPATDRPEVVAAGVGRVVGTDTGRIVAAVTHLLRDPAAYAAMAQVHHPYGDGHAAERVVAVLRQSQPALPNP